MFVPATDPAAVRRELGIGRGPVLIHIGTVTGWYDGRLTMAVGNGAGGWLGAHVALKKGSAWVRIVFLAVVSALLVRLTWQVLKG